MIDIKLDKIKPNENELEITLLGAGSNAGESIVVHLASNQWMVIDSCKSEGEVLPLYYLKHKDINLENVAFVICTHWHKDHVRGLSEVIKECTKAKLVLPAFFSDNKHVFRAMVWDSVTKQSVVASELHKCWQIIDERTGPLREAAYLGPRDELKTVEKDGIKVVVRSFSPSDHMKKVYDILLAKSTFEEMANADFEANMCSSVIDITTDNARLSVLLGADIEANRAHENDFGCKGTCNDCFEMGWCNIIVENEKLKERTKYNYIKAAHHSSVNGYCPELMDTKVDKENTIITTTAFENKAGVRLPKAAMLQQYKSKVDNYFITASHPKPVKGKDEKTDIEKQKDTGIIKKPEVIETQCGIITTRFDINTGQLTRNDLIGCARKVDNDLIQQFA
jgi:ribonuclease BN (tRNA processing enzyme)